jgi:hypothetical protein
MRGSLTKVLACTLLLGWAGSASAQNMTLAQFSPPGIPKMPTMPTMPSVPGTGTSTPSIPGMSTAPGGAVGPSGASMTNPLAAGAQPAPAGMGYNCAATNITPHGQFGWHCFFQPAVAVGTPCTCPTPSPTRTNPTPQQPQGKIIH